MCIQRYKGCQNRSCGGFSETLPLIPCENRPDCEIECIRVRRSRSVDQPYCPNCRRISALEREHLMSARWRERTGYNAKRRKTNNGTPVSTNQQIEPNTNQEFWANTAAAAPTEVAMVSDSGETLYPPDSVETAVDPVTEEDQPHPSSTFPTDPALLQVDAILSSGPDWVANMRDAEQFLRDSGAWAESLDSNKPSEDTENKDEENGENKEGFLQFPPLFQKRRGSCFSFEDEIDDGGGKGLKNNRSHDEGEKL